MAALKLQQPPIQFSIMHRVNKHDLNSFPDASYRNISDILLTGESYRGRPGPIVVNNVWFTDQTDILRGFSFLPPG